MLTKFVPNPPGIRALAYTPLMGAAMKRWADYIAEIARSVAPWGPGHGGHYAEMIESEELLGGEGAGARVVARKFTSVWIEFGTSDTPAFGTLRTSVDASGLTLGGVAGYR